uniref:Uncharacterized protein n=1 Tax=Caenorhabditis japonica TaxID=281687 RepID=A0A8R1DZK1_CAEJA
MKLQTGVSSKDLSTLKELAELEKYKEAKEAVEANTKNAETEEKSEWVQKEDDTKSDVFEKLNATKCVTTTENCFLKWENCFLKPDNCCVVKVVRKISN